MRAAITSCDVLVVGGGAAGVAAAVAAGRAGAQVVLLERYGFLGGLATAAQVGTICGLYLRDTAHPKATPVAGGFIMEFAGRLERAAGASRIRLNNGLWVLPYPPPVFASLADALVSESEQVSVMLHTTVAEAQAEGPRLVEVRALAWNEPVALRPRAVVDCSGEATAAALAGAGVENGAGDQVPSLVFVMENVDPGLAERGLLEVRRELRQAVEQGSLPALCERLALVPGTGADGHLALKINLAPASSDLPLWQQMTAWERQARALADELQRFLIANTACCRNARLSSVAPQLGIRSGRRIRGRATLADRDVLGARKSSQGIARGCWPMERWGNAPRPEMTFFNEGDYYETPLDCLRPVELDNVLVAGRCFSAAAGAMTSARVIGTALATGWAAGTAAAFQALGRPLDDAVATLRRQMNQ
ncbi:MAG: FAD-dependent oxidoreductase [Verrucomicrobiota bacterium]